MAKVDTYKCDSCNKQRADEDDRWWHAHIVAGGVVILPWRNLLESTTHIFVLTGAAAVHLCGIECAQKWMSQSLGNTIEQMQKVEASLER